MSLSDKFRLRKIWNFKALKNMTIEARRGHWHVDTR
jgi:hypothetical protein